MRNKTVTIIFIVNLAAMILLTIFFPRLMVSPGKLIDVHAGLDTDCFACHTPFIGSTSEKCTVCHKVEEIGKKTTDGLLIAMENKNVTFHQKLIEENCVSCHSDHEGVKAFRPISQFSHNLLDPALQKQCDTCHSSPNDAIHLKVKGNCAQCHTPEGWIPATFEHEEYFRSVSNRECTGCHQKPDDRLHKKLVVACDICHSLDKW
ncbi:MAG: cytochrome c family protein, partial [Candidatus Kaiserbacteria bacterium]|nr:cytochrome c family protein [Candidatus Kaiserbacteria bacterium]